MKRSIDQHCCRVALGALLALIACNDAQPPELFVWEETFEDVCDGDLPCGWERIGGSAEQARYVRTSFHTGEHGLELTGDAQVRGPGSDPSAPLFTFGSLEARFIARCDAGAGIDIIVGLAEVDADGVDTGRANMTELATVFPPESWTDTPAATLITSEGAFIDGGLGPPLLSQVRVTSVVLSMNGPGRCEIGEILIDDPGSAMRSEVDGC